MGKLGLQGAAVGPTAAVHQAPAGTQGAAGQLAPEGAGSRSQRLSRVSWREGAEQSELQKLQKSY